MSATIPLGAGAEIGEPLPARLPAADEPAERLVAEGDDSLGLRAAKLVKDLEPAGVVGEPLRDRRQGRLGQAERAGDAEAMARARRELVATAPAGEHAAEAQYKVYVIMAMLAVAKIPDLADRL